MRGRMSVRLWIIVRLNRMVSNLLVKEIGKLEIEEEIEIAVDDDGFLYFTKGSD